MTYFLPFTYDEPNCEAAPLWTEGTPADQPVSIEWRPSIACTAEQVRLKHSLTEAPGIPWTTITIAEIRVQSRKAYEILNRITPDGQRFFVRINPPVPESDERPIAKRREIAFFTRGAKQENALALELHRESVISCGVDPDMLYESRVAVFCHLADSYVDHLKAAIENKCFVISSDAGAAEEYLSRFAAPGHWHIARTWEAREWHNMILDLQGKPNKVYQTSAVDQTPYIKAW